MAQGQWMGTYSRVWAVATIARVLSRAGRELRWNKAVGISCLLVIVFPESTFALMLGFGIRILALVMSMPYIHDSQHWSLQSDITTFGSILISGNVLRRKGYAEESSVESNVVLLQAIPVVRFQFILMYTAAALFKLNTAFLDARYSCSTIYLMQLLERNLPKSIILQYPALPAIVYMTAPSLVLVVELAVPILLCLFPRLGMIFTALFHWIIAITPPPNDIASFGVQTLPRILLFAPDPEAMTAAVRSVGDTGWKGIAIVAFAAVTTALQPSTWNESFDLSVPLCGAFVAILLLAASTSRKVDYIRHQQTPFVIFGWLMRIIAIFYSLFAVPLGIMEVGNASPFSSLRKHAGSNHYFLPTGLLQHTFAKVRPDESLLGNVFGGGIVRIEQTNCTYMFGPRGLNFPGEVYGHSHAAVKFLQYYGHSGRQFMPNAFVSAIGNHPPSRYNHSPINLGINNRGLYSNIEPSSQDTFVPYTIAAPELRRVINDARTRNPKENFTIRGTLLSGTVGNETWRASSASSESSFLLHRRVIDDVDQTFCYHPQTESRCTDYVNSVLLSRPSDHWFARILRKILLQMPVPIVQHNDSEIHCMGE